MIFFQQAILAVSGVGVEPALFVVKPANGPDNAPVVQVESPAQRELPIENFTATAGIGEREMAISLRGQLSAFGYQSII
jgi:hypothetical protein